MTARKTLGGRTSSMAQERISNKQITEFREKNLAKSTAMDDRIASAGKALLALAPQQTWVEKNKYSNNAKYLAIGRVEALLDGLFDEWSWEIKDVKQILNGVVAFGTLSARMGSRVYRMDGVGGADIQLKQGSQASDLQSIQAKALEKAPGVADAQALKNAAKKLGKLFGRDLNRDLDGSAVGDMVQAWHAKIGEFDDASDAEAVYEQN